MTNDPLTCPVCNTILRYAPGIGQHCPNPKCSVLDSIKAAYADPDPFRRRNERLKRCKWPTRRIEDPIRVKSCDGSFPKDCAQCGNIIKAHNAIEILPDISKSYKEYLCIRCAISWLMNNEYDRQRREKNEKNR